MNEEERLKKIEHAKNKISLKRQSILLAITRSRLYYKSKGPDEQDVKIMNEIRDIYEQHSFYGYRRIHVVLRRRGFVINHKKTQRLMGLTGLKTLYPRKKTTIKNYAHKVYPYLLKDLKIEYPNQVWQVDITYIKLRGGFVYLVCLIDVYSRRIMGWALMPFLETNLCLEALRKALTVATPEIINSDQGCQFTSDMWTKTLDEEKIKISMDGKGRWVDNVYIERLWRSIKYEAVYLHSFDNLQQARDVLARYIDFYNKERPHQSLDYRTPDEVFNQCFIKPEKTPCNTSGALSQQVYNSSKIERDFMFS